MSEIPVEKPVEVTVVAEAPASAEPTAPVPTEKSDDAWPAIDAAHPLSKFLTKLPAILESTGYDEVYGITLTSTGSF